MKFGTLGKVTAFIAGIYITQFTHIESASSFQIFLDRSDWENAVAGFSVTTETFPDEIPSNLTITFDSGIVSKASANGFDFMENRVFNGRYSGSVDGDSISASENIIWEFPEPIFAFGSDFFNVDTDRLQVTGDFDGTGEQTVLINNTIGARTGFLGIVGDANFNSIEFSDSIDSLEIFQADNFSFAQPISAIPEPSTLLGTFIALGFGFCLKMHKDWKAKTSKLRAIR